MILKIKDHVEKAWLERPKARKDKAEGPGIPNRSLGCLSI